MTTCQRPFSTAPGPHSRFSSRTRHAILFGLVGLSVCLSLPAASVWIEGENADRSTCKPHPWWYDKVKNDVLSGGAWHSNWQDRPGIATYHLDIPEAATYTLYLRANPVQSTMSWRLNDGEWREIDFERGQRGRMNIAIDNKPDLRFIAWCKVASLELEAGRQTLEFKYHSKNNNHGAIDCFCLDSGNWVPSGTMKPGQSAGGGEVPVPPDQVVWLEGEDADRTTFKGHSWYDSVKKDVLSERQWLDHFHQQDNALAAWDFKVLEADTYDFWIRANPTKAALEWQLDGGDWQPLDFANARGQMNIAADNQPDLRYIAWIKAGEVDLGEGAHTLTVRAGKNGAPYHAGIDALAFSRIDWVPSGARKPTIATGEAGPADWFPVTADVDDFAADSIIDISHLIEAPAGRHGFLQARGGALQFERAQQPVKFWGVNSNLGDSSPEEMTQRARWYRKHGINLVRQHTLIGAVGLLRDDGTFPPDRIDRYDRWFAELKQQGIYSTWSVIYPHHGPFVRPEDVPRRLYDVLRAATNQKPRDGAVVSNDWINLNRDLQDLALRYFKALLEHENPYTGLAYRDEPALAVVEMQNESNLFFHTINDLWQRQPELFSKSVRKGFFAFVRETYGSREAVEAAWDGKWIEGDDWEAGELSFAAPYHWGLDGPEHQYADQHRRVGDFIEYLASIQRDYYERRYRELRELGFKGVIVTTAWKGVGSSSLANLWCDTAGDMIDRHNYVGGGAGRHVIHEGKVSTVTHLDRPGRGLLNLGLFQVAEMPFSVSEWSMTPPAPYKAEAAPLFAFYGLGLQDWDASYHFATSAQRLGDGWPGLGKYVSHTPHYMGQFPALAFALYHGHIAAGEPVARRRVSKQQVYSGRDELGQSLGQGDHDYKELGDQVATPPEFLAIGKVELAFADGDSEFIDPATYWDLEAKRIRSTTGQLIWHYGDRYVEVRSPKTQAVIGFAGGRTIVLPGVTVELTTPFVSLIFTPLDNLPLAESKQILITAMARDKQTGTQYNDDWSQLVQVGGPPLLMEPVQATIRLNGDAPALVRPLDIYGVPRDNLLAIDANGAFTIDGTHRAYYYELKR